MESKDYPQRKKVNIQPGDLKRYFLNHLNKLYCAKGHLVSRLPAVLDLAKFADLREAISETIADISSQLVRMREIYQIMDADYESSNCRMFMGLIDDLFSGVADEEGNPELQDMSIIYYLQNIESLEMASFHALQMAAVKFENEDVSQLLQDNFDEAKAERTLLRLITAKYLVN